TEDRGCIRADVTPAIDQRQSSLRTQAEEVDEGLAGTKTSGLAANRVARRGSECRDSLQRVADIVECALFDFFGAEDQGRFACVDTAKLNARTGYDNDLAGVFNADVGCFTRRFAFVLSKSGLCHQRDRQGERRGSVFQVSLDLHGVASHSYADSFGGVSERKPGQPLLRGRTNLA